MPEELEIPEGDDAFSIRHTFDGDVWEDEISAAFDRGEQEFTIDVNVTWIDDKGNFHEWVETIYIKADSIDDFWDQYHSNLEDMIDDLPVGYEDAALTG